MGVAQPAAEAELVCSTIHQMQQHLHLMREWVFIRAEWVLSRCLMLSFKHRKLSSKLSFSYMKSNVGNEVAQRSQPMSHGCQYCNQKDADSLPAMHRLTHLCATACSQDNICMQAMLCKRDIRIYKTELLYHELHAWAKCEENYLCEVAPGTRQGSSEAVVCNFHNSKLHPSRMSIVNCVKGQGYICGFRQRWGFTVSGTETNCFHFVYVPGRMQGAEMRGEELTTRIPQDGSIQPPGAMAHLAMAAGTAANRLQG